MPRLAVLVRIGIDIYEYENASQPPSSLLCLRTSSLLISTTAMPYLTPRIWNYRDEESSEDYGAISRQTAMITAGVVIGVVILGLVACGCYRRRRNRRR